MASQKQDIDGNSIENSNIQQNQAGRDTVSFLNSHDNQVIIDKTFLRLFGKFESPKVDWDWAMQLLERKQLPEIRKRLTDTLGRDRILMDVLIEEQQAWVNRSPLAADRILQVDGQDCGTLDANKMLIETFGRDDVEGKLLILGAPGAGKTTALLSLAEQLVCGAISQPKTVIPVLFELSTWQDDNQSIEEWLIDRLYDLHGGNRKSKLYEQLLDRQVLLPLLDGLDELGLERQKKCTEKLNEFAKHYPQLVVCCRVKEFAAVDIKLRNLRGAVCLQSLSDSQIENYLKSVDRSDVWAAMQTTPYLQDLMKPTSEGDPGLLRVPLFVKLIADVYDPQQPISSKMDLLDKYIDRQLSFDKREFDRRKELKEYKWAFKIVKNEPDQKKASHHLNWIAQNLQIDNSIDFIIEKMQPSHLNSFDLQNHYFWICIFIELVVAEFFFGICGQINGQSLIYTCTAFVIVLFDASISKYRNSWLKIDLVESFLIPASRKEYNKVLNILKVWLIDWLSSLLKTRLFAGIFVLIGGTLVGIFGLFELHGWSYLFSWTKILLLPLSSEISMLFYSSSRIILELKKEIKVRLYPNQGIWESFKNLILTTIVIYLLLILVSILIPSSAPWILSIHIPFVIGVNGAGKTCLQHLSLRIVLWRNGLPWNFARFLSYCVERRLLLRVGGSYRFLHRELLDHFAESNYSKLD